MYNFSGILYRIWGVGGIILTIGLLCILLEKPWKKDFSVSKIKFGLFMVVFAICLSLFYLSRILCPDISLYTGQFLESHRNSREAPPLPVTYEYIFWDGTAKKTAFYLDAFSKKQIFPHEFNVAQQYTVYFDELTHVIVDIDVAE